MQPPELHPGQYAAKSSGILAHFSQTPANLSLRAIPLPLEADLPHA